MADAERGPGAVFPRHRRVAGHGQKRHGPPRCDGVYDLRHRPGQRLPHSGGHPEPAGRPHLRHRGGCGRQGALPRLRGRAQPFGIAAPRRGGHGLQDHAGRDHRKPRAGRHVPRADQGRRQGRLEETPFRPRRDARRAVDVEQLRGIPRLPAGREAAAQRLLVRGAGHGAPERHGHGRQARGRPRNPGHAGSGRPVHGRGRARHLRRADLPSEPLPEP